MGSHPSDKVPQQRKFSFATINSAPSNNTKEHWILIARLDKTYYLADSLDRRRTIYSVLTKENRRMVPRKLQKTDSFCGFHEIYSAFLILISTKFLHLHTWKTNLNNNFDALVWNFRSNFM